MVLSAGSSDHSNGSSHYRSGFSIPGTVAVWPGCPVDGVFQNAGDRVIILGVTMSIASAARTAALSSATFRGGFDSSSWLNPGIPSSSKISTVVSAALAMCRAQEGAVI